MSIEEPTNQAELIEHCKKRLSFLKINITADQEKILIKKAVKKFLEFHQAATDKKIIAHQITQDISDTHTFVTPPEVYEVNRVLSIRGALNGTQMEFGFGDSYQNVSLAAYGAPASGYGSYSPPMAYYFLAKQNQALYQSVLNREDIFTWSPTSRKLQIIGNNRIEVGKFIVYVADVSLESEPRFWQTEWLIDYVVELFKKQWGENLGKFNNVELPGNIQLNGNEMKSEANSRITELEEELINKHANYTMIFIS